MITDWTLSNFKCIRDDGVDIPLAPLTIIAGTNSSGKSTVLQSMLLIRQTLQSRFKEQQLLLNGELVKLGIASDVLHFQRQDQGLQIGGSIDFRLSKNARTKDLTFNIAFERSTTGPESLTLARSHFAFETQISGVKNVPETEEGNVEIEIEKAAQSSSEEGFGFRVTTLTPELISTSTISAIDTEHFLPSEIRVAASPATEFNRELVALRSAFDTLSFIPEQQWFIEDYTDVRVLSDHILTLLRRAAAEVSLPEKLRRELDSVSSIWGLQAWARKVNRERRGLLRNKSLLEELNLQLIQSNTRIDIETYLQQEPEVVAEASLPRLFRTSLKEFSDYFAEQLHYLGPLRDDPRLIYASPDNIETKDVGLKGEYTAAMLERYFDEEIVYPLPGFAEAEDPQGYFTQGSLHTAVTTWLQEMGLASAINTHEIVSVGHEIRVQETDLSDKLPLTSVGVGVSQALPTLVLCLLVPAPCTLLIEQPELHLHPRVQSLLGDFFLGMAWCGKQCIVETHSEHIVNRLRRRIAEDQSGDLLSDTAILFVERKDGCSKFQRVHLNEYGAIPWWPEGFFDQGSAESQAILRAAQRKRRGFRKQ